MPFVIPALVGVAAVVGASAIGVTSAIAITAISTVASGLASFAMGALLKPASQTSQPTNNSSGGNAPVVDNKVTIRQSAAPRPIVYGVQRVGGVYGFVHTTENNRFLHLIVLIAGHEINRYADIYFNEQILQLNESEQVVNSKYAGLAMVKRHLGSPNQGADGTLVALSEGAWTESDRLRGIAYLYVRLEWDAEVFADGIPNITALIEGKRDLYNPLDGTPGNYTPNAALCLANYLCDPIYGLGVDMLSGIDQTALVAATQACGEIVLNRDGTQEFRYTADGVLSSDAEPQEIIGRLLGSMHGRISYDGEKWRIIAGVWQTPTVALTADHLRAGPRIQTLTSRRDLFNAVKGTFIGPGNNWQKADFPPVKSAAFASVDGGEIWKDIELPLTRSPARAQRIAKIDLLKARQMIVAHLPCKLSAWRVQSGDTITYTDPRYGWVAKEFEVKRATLVVDMAGATLGVDLEVLETSSTIYDFATNEESLVDPAPNTRFPSTAATKPPTNLTITESLYVTRDGGGVKAKATLNWNASPDHFVVSGGQYQAGYKLSSGSVWTDLPRVVQPTIDVLDIAPGIYDFRVAAVNWAGTRSAYITQTGRHIGGLSAPPAAPTGFTLVANGNFAMARWDFPATLDVAIGGVIVFKHASQFVGAGWADGVTVGRPLPAMLTAVSMPLVAGTYMAKYQDASGVWSEGFASYVVAQSGALDFDVILGSARIEDPEFTGAKTDCVALDGELRLGGAGLFSEIPVVSEVPSVAYWGGVKSSGSYAWSSAIDLGVKTRCRLTVNKTTLIANVFDLVSQRTTLISTWPRFGGDTSGVEADAHTEVRYTDDDPAGAPSWSAWTRLDVGEFDARGFELRTILESFDDSYDVVVSGLNAVAEEVV